MLIVPPAVLANERNVFNLAAPNECTECLPAGAGLSPWARHQASRLTRGREVGGTL